MIKMDNWTLGEGDFKSAVVFELSKKDGASFSGNFDGWKFSIAYGLLMVQTKQKIYASKLHHKTYEICEKILDMNSVKLLDYNILQNPMKDYLLFNYEGKHRGIIRK